MPSGDDLTIVLFFVGTAVSIALAALSAAGWRQWVLFSLAGICFVGGLAWTNLKTVSPSVTSPIGLVATNPFAWFIILMLGAASLRFIQKSVSTRSGNALLEQPRTGTTSEQVEQSSLGEISFKNIIEVYRDRTKIQADELVLHHIGRLVEVSGTLNDTRMPSGKGGDIMVFIKDKDSTSIYAMFANTFYERLSFIPHGTKIIIRGKIKEIDAWSVGLVDCSLIDIEHS